MSALSRCLTIAWSVAVLGVGEGQAQERPAATFLPAGDVFAPLTADLREPQLHLAVVQSRGWLGGTTLWLADHGESVGLVRWGDAERAVQVGLSLAKLAQLDLGQPSSDLVNADFVIGVPVSVRRGAWSARLHLHHVSAHLGDEYLVRTGTAPRNISYEVVDLVVSSERGGARVYGGGNVAVRRSPASARSGAVQLGAEVRSRPVLALQGGAQGRLVVAMDARLTRERDWKPGLGLHAGVEFGGAEGRGSGRRLSLLGEFYTGPVPYGQFFRDDVTFAGAALQVSF